MYAEQNHRILSSLTSVDRTMFPPPEQISVQGQKGEPDGTDLLSETGSDNKEGEFLEPLKKMKRPSFQFNPLMP